MPTFSRPCSLRPRSHAVCAKWIGQNLIAPPKEPPLSHFRVSILASMRPELSMLDPRVEEAEPRSLSAVRRHKARKYVSAFHHEEEWEPRVMTMRRNRRSAVAFIKDAGHKAESLKLSTTRGRRVATRKSWMAA